MSRVPRLWYSPYILFPRTALNKKTKSHSRPGFLLKLQTEDFEAGYADCHPWKIFGDEPLSTLLRRLKEGKFTALLERSLFFAQLDGHARAENRSLFDKKIKIRSHYTWSWPLEALSVSKLNKIREKKYSTIKLKMAGSVNAQVRALQALPLDVWKEFRWRLDFNGVGGEKLLSRMPKEFIECIDFVEDPEPYSLQRWKKIESQFAVSTAFDQPSMVVANRSPYPNVYEGLRIIKPARQMWLARDGDVITNSMDHPVGQSFAFWQAQESVRQNKIGLGDCGLKTSHLFKSNAFFQEIFSEGPYFKPSDGTGVGFDHLLKRKKWLPL
jgi:o-succinylbenzoate synthase